MRFLLPRISVLRWALPESTSRVRPPIWCYSTTTSPSIVSAVEEGRAVYDNIRKFILTYILTSNVPELVPYLAFAFFKIPLALTIVQILAVDLGTDMVPALGLGTEKAEPGVMDRPPRSRHERVLEPALLARACIFLGGFEAITAMAAFFFVWPPPGHSSHHGVPGGHRRHSARECSCAAAVASRSSPLSGSGTRSSSPGWQSKWS